MELAKSKYDTIRKNVAEHPNIDIETLRLLSGDRDFLVKRAVAKHSSTSGDTLHLIATDASNVAKPVLDPANDWTKVSRAKIDEWKGILDIVYDWRGKDRTKIRLSVTAHPNALIATLEFLAVDTEANVRRAVADNPKTPLEVALLLDPLIERD